MENASKALIIAGAILLGILIIAIGMYIYNSASSNIVSSMSLMNDNEIMAFNSNFEYYRGKQKGTQISALISKLIANGITNKDDENRKPVVLIYKDEGFIEGSNTSIIAGKNDSEYIDHLSDMKNIVDNKHTYNTKFDYDPKTGLLISIAIKY